MFGPARTLYSFRDALEFLPFSIPHLPSYMSRIGRSASVLRDDTLPTITHIGHCALAFGRSAFLGGRAAGLTSGLVFGGLTAVILSDSRGYKNVARDSALVALISAVFFGTIGAIYSGIKGLSLYLQASYLAKTKENAAQANLEVSGHAATVQGLNNQHQHDAVYFQAILTLAQSAARAVEANKALYEALSALDILSPLRGDRHINDITTARLAVLNYARVVEGASLTLGQLARDSERAHQAVALSDAVLNPLERIGFPGINSHLVWATLPIGNYTNAVILALGVLSGGPSQEEQADVLIREGIAYIKE
jgi:hypothetical protein